MATCSYNIQLKPSDKVFRHWLGLLTHAKHAFNTCCDIMRSENTSLTLKAVHEAVYDTLREAYPALPAQAVIKVYKDALAAFKSIRKNKHANAKVPRKKHLSMHLDKRLYGRLSMDGITLSNGEDTFRENVPMKLYPKAVEMFSTCMWGEPLLFFRDGVMWLSVPFELPDRPVVRETACGVDLGMRQLFVTSEGRSFRDAKYLKAKRLVRYKKRMLNSVGTKSARRKARKMSRRERNLTKDMCVRAANALLSSTDAGVLVLEDLKKLKKNTSRSKSGYKRRGHNNRMSQVPFAEFREVLSHKAPRCGKRVETVSPTYTSQTDSRTGKRDGERRGRRYVCSDGVVLDADWNAAVNIALRSRHPVSSGAAPLDGGLTPLAGRPMSTGRMRCKPTTDTHPAWFRKLLSL